MARTLHVYYRQGHSVLEVMDSDKTTVLYRVNRNRSRPHLTVSRLSSHKPTEITLIGQATFHHLSSDITFDFPGDNVIMTKSGFLSNSFKVTSSDFRGTWERDGAMSSDIKLVDESQNLMANFENSSFSTSKQGLAKIQKQKRDAKARSGALGATNASHG